MVIVKNDRYQIVQNNQKNIFSKNCIVYCVDDNEKCNLQLCASMFTVKRNTTNDIYVLTVKSNAFINSYKNIGVRVLCVDNLVYSYLDHMNLVNTNLVHPQNISTYFRFFIFKLDVFKKYQKILYLDCDTQIFKNLDDSIFNLSDFDLYACPELKINRNAISDLVDFCKENNLKVDIKQYFNAGVLLFNTQKIDFDTIFRRSLELAKLNFTWHDQDILNILFSDFGELDPKFNDFKFTDPIFQNRQDIVIRHFVGEGHKLLLLGEKAFKTYSEKNSAESIPKILHFIWVGPEVPDYVNMSIDAYRRMNPDFKINFICESDIKHLKNEDAIECMKLIETPGTVYNRMYNNPKNLINTEQYTKFAGIRFSDTLRFYLLEKYGGIYLDNDTYPVKPFDDNLLQHDFRVCRSFIGKTRVNNDICVFDIFFIACVPGKIFEYYKGYDASLGSNHFDVSLADALFEYTDRNFKDYQAIGGNTVYLQHMHDKYYSGKMNLGIDRIHIKHDWKNEEQNYYIDHYNRKSWLK